ncbi:MULTISPECIES: hypothetical protein [unclassified Nitrobacter]|uniref:hypothetical protein n=1 Tax=unclassified Nitrobacter TaxID=2620411 RepID=UPI001AC2E6FC|nr:MULTISPECIES: hypothetical protein [unclassified Nitrobacter]MBN9147404.1 hypothetical protein [Nitrobacter sp.]
MLEHDFFRKPVALAERARSRIQREKKELSGDGCDSWDGGGGGGGGGGAGAACGVGGGWDNGSSVCAALRLCRCRDGACAHVAGFFIAETAVFSLPSSMSRRWPLNMAVSHVRPFSDRTAQIFAASAASDSGPATSRNCMPRAPLLRSFSAMIGRSEVSSFASDFRILRHNNRKPLIELALPRSMPKSVCAAGIGAGGKGGTAVAGPDMTIGGPLLLASFLVSPLL